MRKFLLACITLAAFVGVANADIPQFWAGKGIPMRFALANGTANPTYMDSATFCRGATTQHADTSDAIDLSSLTFPPISVSPNASALDTVPFFRVMVVPSPTTASTVGSDTLYLGVQVSLDGNNWTTVGTPTRTYVASGWTANSIVATELNSNESYVWNFRQSDPDLNVWTIDNLGTAPTPNQLAGYPYMRLIVSGDWTGCLKMTVYGWWQALPQGYSW